MLVGVDRLSVYCICLSVWSCARTDVASRDHRYIIYKFTSGVQLAARQRFDVWRRLASVSQAEPRLILRTKVRQGATPITSYPATHLFIDIILTMLCR